jgi:low affinity Fe/Cu permease
VDGYVFTVPQTPRRDDVAETHRVARLDQPELGRRRVQRSWEFHGSRASHVLHQLGAWSTEAVAGVVAAVLLVGWGVIGIVIGCPRWWELVLVFTTSTVTVVMLFAIQHSQRREELVTQRKLDELLRTQPGADDRMIAAETADDEELAELIRMGPDDPRTEALGAALNNDDGGR